MLNLKLSDAAQVDDPLAIAYPVLSLSKDLISASLALVRFAGSNAASNRASARVSWRR